MQRIKWNDAEVARVVVWAATLTHTEGHDFLQAVKQAQKALAPSRQRPLHQAKVIEALRLPYERELAGLRAGTSQPTPMPTTPQTFAPTPLDKAASPGIDPLESAAKQLIDLVIARLSIEMRKAVNEAVQEVLRTGPRAIGTSAPEPVPNEKVRLPRIIIVGLLGAQQKIVQSALEDIADCRFFEHRANVNQVKATAAYCERGYVMVDFVSHALSNAVTDTIHNATLVRGTTTALLTRLRDDLIGSRILEHREGNA